MTGLSITMKTILFGCSYGANYLPILAGLPEFELIGIYSRGSIKSREYCSRLSIKNYTSLNELPLKDIDLSVIAIGGDDGINIAEHMLLNGSNIIIEHPINNDSFLSLRKTADKENKIFFVNSHYRYLSNINFFINKVLKHGAPKVISCEATSRSLFSILDILVTITEPSEKNIIIQKMQATEDYYQVYFSINGITIFINLQLWKSDIDNSYDSLAGHSIRAIYKENIINLIGAWGSVINYNFPSEESKNNDLFPACSSINDVITSRRNANKEILYSLIDSTLSFSYPKNQSLDHISIVCSLKEDILNLCKG